MALKNLGLCCEWIELVTKKSGKIDIVNTLDQRVLQLGRFRDGKYTEDTIRATYIHNAESLRNNLQKIAGSGIRVFRVSSSMFPLSDQVPRELWDNSEVRGILAQVGDVARSFGMRLSTHPGQFTVLSSDSDSVVQKALVELTHHAWMFDAMGLPQTPYAAINIHGGKADREQRLIEAIMSLSPAARCRLTLENDESSYNVAQLRRVADATGVPIVFDTHHHTFNDAGLDMIDAMSLASETWPAGIAPLQHLSNTDPELVNGSFAERRKHSDLVHYVPEPQLAAIRDGSVDVEIECKLKNIAIFKMVRDFDLA